MIPEPSDNYGRWCSAEVARLLGTAKIDTETVRELLIFSCHSTPPADQFFADRLGDQHLLQILLNLAIEDYSGDAQMSASYWISQFAPEMLVPHVRELIQIANNEWDSVAVHARRALESLQQTR